MIDGTELEWSIRQEVGKIKYIDDGVWDLAQQ